MRFELSSLSIIQWAYSNVSRTLAIVRLVSTGSSRPYERTFVSTDRYGTNPCQKYRNLPHLVCVLVIGKQKKNFEYIEFESGQFRILFRQYFRTFTFEIIYVFWYSWA